METKTGNVKFHLCNVSETNDADLNCVCFLVQSLLLPFLSDWLGDTKTTRPFALKGHGSIAHSALPHELLTRSPFGLRV